jgi:foldase protein PrsA
MLFLTFYGTAGAGTTSNYAIIINENIIPLNKFEKNLKETIEKMQRVQSIDTESPEGQALVSITKRSLIQEYINQYLLANGGKKLGVGITTENVLRQIDRLKKGYPNEQEFLADLNNAGISFPELMDNVKGQLLTEGITKKLIENLAISDAEVERYLAKNPDFAKEQAKKQVLQIVVDDKAEAQYIIKKIKEGESFIKLAQDFSVDEETRGNGGDLGFIDLKMLPEKARKPVSRLKKGEISKIIEMGEQFFIFKAGPALIMNENKKNALKMYLRKILEENIFEKWLAKEKAEAQISVSSALEYFYNKDIDPGMIATWNASPGIQLP